LNVKYKRYDNTVKTARRKVKVAIAQEETIPTILNGTMFADLV